MYFGVQMKRCSKSNQTIANDMTLPFIASERKKKAIEEKLLEVAKTYVTSSSIDEFLVRLDLRPDLHISICKWTNPFIVHHMMKNKSLKFIFSLLPFFVCGIGILSLFISSGLIALKCFCVILQFSLLSMQIWLGYKDIVAQHHISQVKIGILKEMYS